MNPADGGGTENTNGLIRQYFPKSRDFTTITDSDTQAVRDKLIRQPTDRENALAFPGGIHSEKHLIKYFSESNPMLHLVVEPKIERTVQVARNVKNGTMFTIHWPEIASDILNHAEDKFLQLASDFTFLNPHLTLTVDWFGQETRVKATAPDWKKWKPSDPTSPHWYGSEDFERLLAAYIGYDQDRDADRYVRDVVKEFRGLSGSSKQKAVLDFTGMGRTRLSSLANDDGVDHAAAARLLEAMQDNSKEVKPAALGIIGKDHLRQRFVESGGDERTFHYKKMTDIDEGVPVVIETAFALFKKETENRRIITGVNWSGAIGNPFRSFGASYRDGFNALLEKQMAGWTEPVMLLLHCACARVRYTDRGKTNIAIS